MNANLPPQDPSDPGQHGGPRRPTPPAGGSPDPRRPRVPIDDPGTYSYAQPVVDASALGIVEQQIAAVAEDQRRRFTWATVVAGLAAVVAIVALVLAISAGNKSTDSDEIADEVRRQAHTVTNQIERQIRDETAKANEVLEGLRESTDAAKNANSDLAADTKKNTTAIEDNAKEIAAAKKSLEELSAKLDGLPAGVSGLEDLEKQVADLETQAGQLASQIGDLQGGAGADGSTP